MSSLDEQHLRQIQEVARLMEANVGDLAAKEYAQLWGFDYDPAANNDDLVVRLDKHVQSLVDFERVAGDAKVKVQIFGPAIEVQVTPPPPPQAERLLNYVLPKARREEILGDLQEDYYATWLPKFGPREARRLYWWHAVRSIAPMLWTGVKRSALITAIAGVLDWLRG